MFSNFAITQVISEMGLVDYIDLSTQLVLISSKAKSTTEEFQRHNIETDEISLSILHGILTSVPAHRLIRVIVF